MRLFKLLVIGIIIGSLYFYAKQHTDNASESSSKDDRARDWQRVAAPHGVSIKFPKQPVSKSFQKNIPSLGKVKLTSYQVIQDGDIFVLLHTLPLEINIKQEKLTVLEDAIHSINDTEQLTITNKKHFILQSYNGLEYKAINAHGSIIWCRTFKRGGQLYSVIYGSEKDNLNHQLRDAFFKSLQT